MTNKIGFDDKAHSIISELLDNTEDWLVRFDECEPEKANDRLAYDYIMRCAGMIRGATTYVDSDECVGTGHFLSDLRGAKTKLRSARNRIACVAHLMRFQREYFPNYALILRLVYLRELDKQRDRNECILSGTIKLASAKLPGVRSDVRRKLRSLGLDREALLVPDDTLERKLLTPRLGLFT